MRSRAASNVEVMLKRETVQKYRAKGYEVSTEAPLDFFAGFVADVVARRGEETRVIEVKSRSTLAADPRIGELADILDSRDGWTFELVLAGEPETRDSPDGARTFDRVQIEERLQKAQTALNADIREGAFLLAWSACEAVMRDLVAVEGVSKEEITSASYVLSQARHLGILSSEQYRQLEDLQKYRNAIVHGFGHEQLDIDTVMSLVDTTRALMEEGS